MIAFSISVLFHLDVKLNFEHVLRPHRSKEFDGRLNVKRSHSDGMGAGENRFVSDCVNRSPVDFFYSCFICDSQLDRGCDISPTLI